MADLANLPSILADSANLPTYLADLPDLADLPVFSGSARYSAEKGFLLPYKGAINPYTAAETLFHEQSLSPIADGHARWHRQR
jgi:hypothetical protein